MKFEYLFSHDIETISALLTDPQYLVDRTVALGAFSAEGELIEGDNQLELTLTRQVETDLPPFVAKIMGSEQSLVIKEVWQRDGDDWVGTSDTQAIGKPITIHIKFKLVSVGEGCRYSADIRSKVSIPFIGKKIETFANGKVVEEMTADMDYTSKLLSE